MPRQVGVVCYICGREFGTRSIGIHEPQCLKKWETQNSKLPKKKQQSRPVKPVEFDQPFSKDPAVKAAQIAKINEASNAAASDNLVSCKKCSRRFLPTRIEHHEEICRKLKMGPATSLQSGSGYYGQRVVVVDGEQVDAIAFKKERSFSTNTIVKKDPVSDYSAPARNNKNNATNVLQNKVGEQISKNVMMKGPLRTLPCQFCGKAISHNAINIHIKKCKSRSEPPRQKESPKFEKCSFCHKDFPSNVISVHSRNCSSAPKVLTISKGPPDNANIDHNISKPKVEKSFPKKNISNLRHTDPPNRAKDAESPPISSHDGPFSRYNSSRPNSGLRARSTDRMCASLEGSLVDASNYVEVDLVIGVDPGLVLNCMICGLLVLKSKLNTHYHNFCKKSNLNRSVTMAAGGNMMQPTQPTPPITPQNSLVPCEICNRSFKASVIENHEIQCALKNQEDLKETVMNPELSRIREKTITDGPSDPFTTNGLKSPTQVIGKVVTGKFVPCVNCGKSFTIRSLVIHQKQCMQ